MKRITKIVGAVGLVGALLFTGGCGSSSSSTGKSADVPSTPITVNGTDGTTAAPVVITTDLSSVTIPTGTFFLATDGSLIKTTVTATGTVSQTVGKLPAAAQTLPTGKDLSAFIDMTLTAGTAIVKTVGGNPIQVTLSVDAADGTALTVYSFDGANWSQESTATVQDGKATFNITHFSVWGVFKAKSTGTGTGTGGNGTAGGQ